MRVYKLSEGIYIKGVRTAVQMRVYSLSEGT